MLLDSSIWLPFIRVERWCLIPLCALIPKGAFPEQIKSMVSLSSISYQVASAPRRAARNGCSAPCSDTEVGDIGSAELCRELGDSSGCWELCHTLLSIGPPI